MRYSRLNIFNATLIAFGFSACDQTSSTRVETNETRAEKSFFEKLTTIEKAAPEKLKPAEYINWCENSENGLKASKKIGDFVFSTFYKPSNYLALKEFKVNDSIIEKDLNAKDNEYGDLTYYTFKIENTKQSDELLKINVKSAEEYYGRLEYMAFKMQQDFKLIQGNDTLDCNIYHFERVYGLAPHATFVLAFPKTKKNIDVKFWFHDKIFNNGIVMLNYEKETLMNLPKLDI